MSKMWLLLSAVDVAMGGVNAEGVWGEGCEADPLQDNPQSNAIIARHLGGNFLGKSSAQKVFTPGITLLALLLCCRRLLLLLANQVWATGGA